MNRDILHYLYGLGRFGIKLGLETVTGLLNLLGDPHQKYKSIHLAGTNGKGSTAAFLAQILREAGYTVGLYTSPHLIKFNERIKINGKDISNQDLMELVATVREKVKEHHLQPTFFEFTTALAFLYFAQKEIDIAVIETGMGGRLDATNVIQPEISIITNISLDHQQYLGETKEKIAMEKAGIIKQGGIVITAENDKEVIKIIERNCIQNKAKLFFADEMQLQDWSLDGQNFITNGCRYTISLLGEHQLQNAAVTIKAASLLRERGFSISPQNIQQGLKKAYWPGRLEVVYDKPFILVDCAHNVAGMQELAKFIHVLPQKKILLLGIAADKQIPEMVSLIAPLVEEVIISKGSYKPADPMIIAEEAKKYVDKVVIEPEPEKALREALSRLQDEDALVVTGSIYFVGEILKYRNQYHKLFKEGAGSKKY